jgi:deazaflavin-dependent oxidoreductase (nitroreductase family)
MYRYTEAGALRRIVRQATTSRPLAWLSARILHRIDRVPYRSTRGRFTFSRWMSGLPVVMLTTTGARTGQPRTTPVLGIPAADGLVVVAANFGQHHHPAWYYNLRAHPRVSVTADGMTREYDAHELTGGERDQQFQEAVQMNPGWLRYRTWAGDRQIPVIRLDRVVSEPEAR